MRRLAIPLSAVLFAGAAAAQAPTDQKYWAARTTPAPGPAAVIGSYSNGCLRGAVALPPEGDGFIVLRTHRNRFWGHPDLVSFVKDLGTFTKRNLDGALMIADLGQPRGGPITGHGSHELGLDADIRLLIVPPGAVTKEMRRAPKEVGLVRDSKPAGNEKLETRIWSGKHVRLYEAAARHPKVDRIFAHPVLKRTLCAQVKGDRAWLAKVRPWYGHHAHMHVRLKCPKDSPDCKPQNPVPAGDGCGAPLAWWFTPEPYEQLRARQAQPPKPPAPMPAGCAEVYGAE